MGVLLAGIIALGAAIVGCSNETDSTNVATEYAGVRLSYDEYLPIVCNSGDSMQPDTLWGEYAEDMVGVVARVEVLVPPEDMQVWHEAFVAWSKAMLDNAQQRQPDEVFNQEEAVINGTEAIRETFRAVRDARSNIASAEANEAIRKHCFS